MFTGILLALDIERAAIGPLTFPVRPIDEEVHRGQRIARRKADLDLNALFGIPADRTALGDVLAEDRAVIGSWFDGKYKIAIEHVIWFSPKLISRWLSFMSEREYWEKEEADRRWAILREHLNEKLSFIVRLSAYPKVSFLEITDYKRTTTKELEEVRFVVLIGTQRLQPQVKQLALWQARDRKALDRYRWYGDVPFGPWLAPEFDQKPPEKPWALGDYYAAWYWVEVPLTKESREASRIELRVLSHRKERIASFPPEPSVFPEPTGP